MRFAPASRARKCRGGYRMPAPKASMAEGLEGWPECFTLWPVAAPYLSNLLGKVPERGLPARSGSRDSGIRAPIQPLRAAPESRHIHPSSAIRRWTLPGRLGRAAPRHTFVNSNALGRHSARNERKDARAQRRKGGEVESLLPPSGESAGFSRPIQCFPSVVFFASLRPSVFAFSPSIN